jgi:acyl phosphate:glycerol-3-phosphate acyltransferase
MTYAAACIVAYLLGSIPVSLLVARRHGVDLRRTADGNPGAWNALEQLGPRRAWPAFAGDALKGTAAGLLGVALGGVWGGYAAVGAAMLGHAFPLFAGLRGGKSVMTFAGGMLAVAPLAAAISIGVCAAVVLTTRSFAWGARAGVFGFPLVQLALDPGAPAQVAATGALMCLIGARFLIAGRARSGAGARAHAREQVG